jgi:hypothetical protein
MFRHREGQEISRVPQRVEHALGVMAHKLRSCGRGSEGSASACGQKSRQRMVWMHRHSGPAGGLVACHHCFDNLFAAEAQTLCHCKGSGDNGSAWMVPSEPESVLALYCLSSGAIKKCRIVDSGLESAAQSRSGLGPTQ